MRLPFALLALLALLVSPVIAAAGQGACTPSAMAEMTSDSGRHADPVGLQNPVADPCCDPAGRQKDGAKSCAQVCAATSSLAATQSGSPLAVAMISTAIVRAAPPTPSMRAYRPAGPERPPKSST